MPKPGAFSLHAMKSVTETTVTKFILQHQFAGNTGWNNAAYCDTLRGAEAMRINYLSSHSNRAWRVTKVVTVTKVEEELVAEFPNLNA